MTEGPEEKVAWIASALPNKVEIYAPSQSITTQTRREYLRAQGINAEKIVERIGSDPRLWINVISQKRLLELLRDQKENDRYSGTDAQIIEAVQQDWHIHGVIQLLGPDGPGWVSVDEDQENEEEITLIATEGTLDMAISVSEGLARSGIFASLFYINNFDLVRSRHGLKDVEGHLPNLISDIGDPAPRIVALTKEPDLSWDWLKNGFPGREDTVQISQHLVEDPGESGVEDTVSAIKEAILPEVRTQSLISNLFQWPGYWLVRILLAGGLIPHEEATRLEADLAAREFQRKLTPRDWFLGMPVDVWGRRALTGFVANIVLGTAALAAFLLGEFPAALHYLSLYLAITNIIVGFSEGLAFVPWVVEQLPSPPDFIRARQAPSIPTPVPDFVSSQAIASQVLTLARNNPGVDDVKTLHRLTAYLHGQGKTLAGLIRESPDLMKQLMPDLRYLLEARYGVQVVGGVSPGVLPDSQIDNIFLRRIGGEVEGVEAYDVGRVIADTQQQQPGTRAFHDSSKALTAAQGQDLQGVLVLPLGPRSQKSAQTWAEEYVALNQGQENASEFSLPQAVLLFEGNDPETQGQALSAFEAAVQKILPDLSAKELVSLRASLLPVSQTVISASENTLDAEMLRHRVWTNQPQSWNLANPQFPMWIHDNNPAQWTSVDPYTQFLIDFLPGVKAVFNKKMWESLRQIHQTISSSA